MAQRDLLKPARRGLEKHVMRAGLRISYDAQGSADDVFDVDTGLLVKPLNDAEWVFDEWSIGDGGRSLAHPSGLGGIGYIGPVSSVRAVQLQVAGGAAFGTTPYECMIPLDAPNEVGIGAVIEVVAAEFPIGDPALVGREWVVKSVQAGALAAARVFIAEERIRAAD